MANRFMSASRIRRRRERRWRFVVETVLPLTAMVVANVAAATIAAIQFGLI